MKPPESFLGCLFLPPFLMMDFARPCWSRWQHSSWSGAAQPRSVCVHRNPRQLGKGPSAFPSVGLSVPIACSGWATQGSSNSAAASWTPQQGLQPTGRHFCSHRHSMSTGNTSPRVAFAHIRSAPPFPCCGICLVPGLCPDVILRKSHFVPYFLVSFGDTFEGYPALVRSLGNSK